MAFFFRAFDLKLIAKTPTVLAAEVRPNSEENLDKQTPFLVLNNG